MSGGNHLSMLDAWDELTRGVRPPMVRRRAASHISTPLGALVVGAVVIATLAFLSSPKTETPATGSDPTASVTARPTPSSDLPSRHVGLTWIRDVTLSEDRTVAHVVFAAGTCEYGYEGTAREIDGVLEIGVYVLRDPAEPATSRPSDISTVCADVGIWKSLDLSLEAAFTGGMVRDLYGQILWLHAPPWLAVVSGLPDGWALQREGNVIGTPTPRWERVWSPVRNPDPVKGDSIVTLIQSFGGPVNTEGGGERSFIEVNGRPATLSVEPYPFGSEMLLVWSIGDSEFALIGWDRDFARPDFIDLAESITMPSPVQLEGRYVRDQVMARFRTPLNDTDLGAFAARHGVEVLDYIGLGAPEGLGWYRFQIGAGVDVIAVRDRLRLDPLICNAELIALGQWDAIGAEDDEPASCVVPN